MAALTQADYDRAAELYAQRCNPDAERTMESVAQATQRTITLVSFQILRMERPDVQVFNELLVQYPRPRTDLPGQVVPDNMIVVHPEPIVADGSYNLPDQPVGPLIVMEYVSRSNMRKDYEENFDKYERRVRVPYYVLFHPETMNLTVYHLRRRAYTEVKPNADGRRSIPDLDLEVGVLNGWMRYWYRGRLLPMVEECLPILRAENATFRAENAAFRAENAALRAENARLKGK